jgi:mono/diheme cytochrome c family protein
MPGFGAAYSDAEIAAVANYVTGRLGSQPSHITPNKVAMLRWQHWSREPEGPLLIHPHLGQ